DLTSVFELFIFSDILELNREILIEGNSLILTLIKSISNDENRFKRFNVQKIGSLKDMFNSPIKEVSFDVKSYEEINEISKLLNENGKTFVNINFITNKNNIKFRLKNTRYLDRKSLNLLRKREISSIIS
ncbi:DNA polymerase III subunit alpha, partial [Candidatus Pelagibacter sp.]|nr:DNA polymerase III subunit alpha [Candidatus Pelagibacter sp.]